MVKEDLQIPLHKNVFLCALFRLDYMAIPQLVNAQPHVTLWTHLKTIVLKDVLLYVLLIQIIMHIHLITPVWESALMVYLLQIQLQEFVLIHVKIG